MSGGLFNLRHRFFYFKNQMKFFKPPTDIAPEVLFRQLLVIPRPIKEINFRFNQLPGKKIFVEALSSAELDSLIKTSTNFQLELMVKCLKLSNGNSVFSCADNIEKILLLQEFNKLQREINQALLEISPTFLNSDYSAWTEKLMIGAQHPSNFFDSHSLGSAISYSNLGNNILQQDHPEIYFGVARNKLIDAHWFVFNAAKKIYKMRNDL